MKVWGVFDDCDRLLSLHATQAGAYAKAELLRPDVQAVIIVLDVIEP